MAGKRKQHTDEFKARVALEAIKGFKTMSELSSAHSVHPSVIAHWKRQLLDGAAEVFSRGMGVSRTEEQLTVPFSSGLIKRTFTRDRISASAYCVHDSGFITQQ